MRKLSVAAGLATGVLVVSASVVASPGIGGAAAVPAPRYVGQGATGHSVATGQAAWRGLGAASPGNPTPASRQVVQSTVASYNSPTYAGYEVPSGNTPVATNFVVPPLACPTGPELGVVAGAILGGADYLGAGVNLFCSGGQASYTPVAYFDGPFQDLNLSVAPGDTVSVQISDLASSSTSTATVTDQTTGAADSRSFPNIGASYADFGVGSEYDYYTTLGVPPFGSIAYSGATYGGQPIGSLSPYQLTRGNGTTTLIRTSALNTTGTSFTTTFKRSHEPTNVQGRVIEGIAGQTTISATMWPATFTSTASSNPTSFVATIDWGDGTSSTSGAVNGVSRWNCVYGPIQPVGKCFSVGGQHVYATVGNYAVYLTVTGPGGAASVAGIAEIVAPTPPGSATDSVGVLTWTGANGSVNMCTATAVSQADLVITAKHCFDSNIAADYNFEFAPQHTGNCGSGSTIMSLGTCESSGSGHDPYGYWTGSYALAATFNSPADAGQDTVLVAVYDSSSTGVSLDNTIGGLPLHFDSSHGNTKISTYGYPGRVGDWTRRSCVNEPDLSTSSDVVLGISPCDFGYSNGKPSGVSGAPFISDRFLPHAIAATMWFICPPGGGCTDPSGQSLVWPHAESQDTAVANYLSDNAMQLYLVSLLGIQP